LLDGRLTSKEPPGRPTIAQHRGQAATRNHRRRGIDTPLTGRRIGPDQNSNLALEHDITADWLVRLQYNHSEPAISFPGSAVGNY